MTFPILGGNGAVGGYTIDNSLRFNRPDSPTLSRTPSSTGNNQTWTFSTWYKKTDVSQSYGVMFGSVISPSAYFTLRFQDDDKINIISDSGTYLRAPNRYRDVSAWYHIVLAVDTTQGTSSNRIKLYFNGNQITNWESSTYPSLNFDTKMSTSGSAIYINRPSDFFDGYLAETHFIDGQQLSPTDFGEFDTDSGVWQPIEYTGSYGTNGFYLDFENSGSLGADQSGNGNNFTPTNLASTDQTTDTPTNNFATLNALSDSGATLSEGNTQGVGSPSSATSTIAPTSGKWYVEFQNSALQNSSIGLVNLDAWASTTDIYPFAQASAILIESNANYNVTYGNTASSPTTLQTGTQYNTSKYGFAFDLDNGNVYVSADGNWYGGSNFNQASFSNAVAVTTDIPINTPMAFFARGSFGSAYYVNFGNPPPSYTITSGNSDGNGYGNFEYAPPSGYLALCTQNLATALSPTIDDGSQYFNTVLYSGDGTTNRTISGVNFQPDWTWIKSRSTTGAEHVLVDSNRGSSKVLETNTTDAEYTNSNAVESFDSDGFTLGSDGYTNNIGRTYVGWSWKASAGSTSSNSDGSITSTVQANTTAGFSIVTYTGNATAGATVGHGLGKKPDMIIAKNRSTTRNWLILHKAYEGTSAENMRFSTMAVASAGSQASSGWYRTAPTSSVFYLGNGSAGDFSGDTNLSGSSMVAYCFAEIEGYSKFGSYEGNAVADGTFVYTGFKPAWIMIKRYSGAGHDWIIIDTKRFTFNVIEDYLKANSSDAEIDTYLIDEDILSNGFKLRGTSTNINGGGSSYIYMAFAENPFVTSGGVPVTAR